MTDATQTNNEEGVADANWKANHPAFKNAWQIAAEGQTEEEETELDEETATEKKEKQKAIDYVIFKALNKFVQMDISSIPKTDALTELQATNVYAEIQGNCNQLGLPITPIEDLTVVKSCQPLVHGQLKETMLNRS